MYNYFVSFNYSEKTGAGVGCCDFKTSKKISNMDQVAKLAKGIEEKMKVEDVIIINFRLFD